MLSLCYNGNDPVTREIPTFVDFFSPFKHDRPVHNRANPLVMQTSDSTHVCNGSIPDSGESIDAGTNGAKK
jgi:hypothetical protein